MADLISRHHIVNNYPLLSLNSFKVPAFADHYIHFSTLKDIEDFCIAVDLTKTPFYILGGGSNTLFVGDFPGYILHVQIQGIEVIKEIAHEVLVKASAGVNWHEFVLFCLKNRYGGVENLSLIPGTVGAAPIQNIGAYGVEIMDVIDTVETIELSTGKKRIFRKSECEFGYRTSIFKKKLRDQYLITGIVLTLHKEDKFSIEYEGIQKMLETMKIKQLSFQAISDAVIAIRQKKIPDPAVLGNAGSFFQNPFVSMEQYQLLKLQYPSLVAFSTGNEGLIKISAAWLIDAAGFKGLRQGNVGVHTSNALILVNYGGATGKDIMSLATQIKHKMASLQGLPPLPKSLSGLLNFSSAQWKELERLHAMRTMIQQDLSRGANLQRVPSQSDGSDNLESEHSSPASDPASQSRSARLDVQLALLRKEMVGLRQLDMSLLCQLWSLNESIHEYKQLLQDRMSLSLSPSHNSSGWDNGMDSPSSEEHGEMNGKSFESETQNSELQQSALDNKLLPRKLSVDSTSHSSLEFGDV